MVDKIINKSIAFGSAIEKKMYKNWLESCVVLYSFSIMNFKVYVNGC